MNYNIGIQILSHNRPEYLRKTIESLLIHKHDNDKICVLEQSTENNYQDECIKICQEFPNIEVIPLFKNMGQRGATNLLYQSGFYNDCDFVMLSDHDNVFKKSLSEYCNILNEYPDCWVATGYHSPEHDVENKIDNFLLKSTCRAGHIVMRKKDFYNIMPSDLKAGKSSWFCGLDWWITHWAPNSPGYYRKQFIYCLPGGVQHIGISSTWQGTYNDEYHDMYDESYDDWILNSSLYNVLLKYPPKHIHIKEKYWYENISEIELKKYVYEKDINVQDSNTNIEDVVVIENKKGNKKIYAFNYVWPTYGLAFLESSIASVIDYVDKYILFLNKFSYIGEECNSKDLDYIQTILDKFDKIEVRYNASKDHPQSAKIDNIGHYYSIIGEIAKNNDIDYVWLVQTDEVYDKDNIDKIISIANNNTDKFCLSFNPYCYIDNPHWVVDPVEDMQRPTFIQVSELAKYNYDYNKLTRFKVPVYFHHLSGVLQRHEMLLKFSNWGHRNDLKSNINDYICLLDNNKTNKMIKNFHPINPSLYSSLKFVNGDINKRLMLDWFYHLLTYNNPYNKIIELFKSGILSFPEDPKNQFTLTQTEMKYLAFIALECIPHNGNIVEYGCWNGFNSLLLNKINPNSNLYCIDNYKNPDPLFSQYKDKFSYVYNIACKRILDNNLKNTRIFDGNHKFISMFQNYLFDFLFINTGTDVSVVKNILIETRPKMKNGSIVVNHYTKNDSIKTVFDDVLHHNKQVICPWGTETFEYYELYPDILGDIIKYKNIKEMSHFGMSFVRIKRFN